MKAALVTAFDSPPRLADVSDPVPVGEHDLLLEVLAVGLHPRVRSQADGSHYTSTAELPLIPGIDGVGRAADGSLRYFVLPDTTHGSMAERVAIDRRRSILLEEDADPVAVAAAMNPVMSSWLALRHRAAFTPGSAVLVLGATGSAGALAVQVARHFGAARIVAAGRNTERLAALLAHGATETVQLDGPADAAARTLGRASDGVDVVLDYVWGAPTAAAMSAVITHRSDRGRPLTWIEIGSVAGPDALIPSAALRSARLQIVGSGQGSVGTREILAELPEMARAITDGAFVFDTEVLPLARAEEAWTAAPDSSTRIVLVP